MNQLPPLLLSITGRWIGIGTALFPTTDTFAYQEETEFTLYPDKKLIQYIQRTWIIDDKQVRIRPSHFETGFIGFDENEVVRLNNAQSGGRVEVLSGKLKGNRLVLNSDLIVNDTRMIRSSRWWTINDSQLSYELMMHTQDTDKPELHLSATLNKIEDINRTL